jgi:hypothetical protein
MRMPKHTLQLLVLLAVFSVAPAAAGPRAQPAVATYDNVACPYERARLAALSAETAQPTRITLTEAAPSLGPKSALLNP